MSANPKSDVSFYEALAQVVLLRLRLLSLGVSNVFVACKQLCDNASAVGAAAKLFSTKQPLCWALQALSHVCQKHCAEVRISHIAGTDNDWADMLSRSDEPKSQSFMQSLTMANEFPVDLQSLFHEVWH